MTQGDYAGLKIIGMSVEGSWVEHVMFVNCIVGTGRADDTGGGSIIGPKYGLWYENTAHLQWIGGDVKGQVAPYHTGGAVNWRPQIIDITRGLLTVPVQVPAATVEVPDGSVYFDQGSSSLKVRSGGAWKSVTLS